MSDNLRERLLIECNGEIFAWLKKTIQTCRSVPGWSIGNILMQTHTDNII